MKYEIEQWTIDDLIQLYEDKKLNLNPTYQRNDIWPPLSKKRLIESLKIGYPLPSFFLHKKEDGTFDMVDGQQRTRTFIGYKKGFFPDTKKVLFDEDGRKIYSRFKIAVVVIETENNDEGTIEDFYFRVNKYGIKLNRPEIKRAEFGSTEFQDSIEQLSDSANFSKLNLFSEKSIERLNDLDFISELLTLIKFGITDKKLTVDRLYENDKIDRKEVAELKAKFEEVLSKIVALNNLFPISATRYKQRNDFYTLFSFILKHGNTISKDVLNYQYKILVLIGDDIYPTNEKCWSFQEYANNCVSQSNSKRAREDRLLFFERLLLNKEAKPLSKVKEGEETEYDTICDVIKYYSLENTPLKKVENYWLPDVSILSKTKSEIKFNS